MGARLRHQCHRHRRLAGKAEQHAAEQQVVDAAECCWRPMKICRASRMSASSARTVAGSPCRALHSTGRPARARRRPGGSSMWVVACLYLGLLLAELQLRCDWGERSAPGEAWMTWATSSAAPTRCAAAAAKKKRAPAAFAAVDANEVEVGHAAVLPALLPHDSTARALVSPRTRRRRGRARARPRRRADAVGAQARAACPPRRGGSRRAAARAQ